MITQFFKKNTSKLDGIYRGIVVDNVDPKTMGRIRIRIYGVMSDSKIPDNSLPWAVPAQPISNGAAVGAGSFYVPRIGSEVFVFFESQDFMSPVYFAEATNGVKGLPSFRTTNYPNRAGFRLANGVQIFFDMTSDLVEVTHPSGVQISITEDGTINVTATNDINVTAAGDVTVVGATVNINPT